MIRPSSMNTKARLFRSFKSFIFAMTFIALVGLAMFGVMMFGTNVAMYHATGYEVTGHAILAAVSFLVFIVSGTLADYMLANW
jgi:sterol desaturase/sphingolipid hydroxylase (fatty acid hydroxylase superfamily)